MNGMHAYELMRNFNKNIFKKISLRKNKYVSCMFPRKKSLETITISNESKLALNIYIYLININIYFIRIHVDIYMRMYIFFLSLEGTRASCRKHWGKRHSRWNGLYCHIREYRIFPRCWVMCHMTQEAS